MSRVAVEPSPTRKPRLPTARQLEILAYLQSYVAKHRMPPTIREIGQAFDMNTNATMGHLKSMKQKGMVEHVEPYQSRGWRPTAALGRCPLCDRPYPKETLRE